MQNDQCDARYTEHALVSQLAIHWICVREFVACSQVRFAPVLTRDVLQHKLTVFVTFDCENNYAAAKEVSVHVLSDT